MKCFRPQVLLFFLFFRWSYDCPFQWRLLPRSDISGRSAFLTNTSNCLWTKVIKIFYICPSSLVFLWSGHGHSRPLVVAPAKQRSLPQVTQVSMIQSSSQALHSASPRVPWQESCDWLKGVLKEVIGRRGGHPFLGRFKISKNRFKNVKWIQDPFFVFPVVWAILRPSLGKFLGTCWLDLTCRQVVGNVLLWWFWSICNLRWNWRKQL